MHYALQTLKRRHATFFVTKVVENNYDCYSVHKLHVYNHCCHMKAKHQLLFEQNIKAHAQLGELDSFDFFLCENGQLSERKFKKITST